MGKIKMSFVEGHSDTIDLVKRNDIKQKFGFVAILDALGTKNSNFEEISEFLKNHLFVIKSLLKN